MFGGELPECVLKKGTKPSISVVFYCWVVKYVVFLPFKGIP